MKLNFDALDEFVEKNCRIAGARAGMTFGPVRVWFRIAARRMNGVYGLTIDIADVEVEEGERRKGAFRSLLTYVECLAKKQALAVYVQSISNEHIVTELQRRGYTFINDDLGVVDAWLSPGGSKDLDRTQENTPSP